jgi:hypothetical protein
MLLDKYGPKFMQSDRGGKIFLASLVLLVMVKMLFDLLITPHVMLAYKGGH